MGTRLENSEPIWSISPEPFDTIEVIIRKNSGINVLKEKHEQVKETIKEVIKKGFFLDNSSSNLKHNYIFQFWDNNTKQFNVISNYKSCDFMDVKTTRMVLTEKTYINKERGKIGHQYE